MLGTGSAGELRSPISDAVAWMNQQRQPVVAVDLPTGIDADTGKAATTAVKADCTVTLGAWKPGLLLRDGPDHAGTVTVAHIGAPGIIYSNSKLRLLDRELAASLLPPITRSRHKYERGNVMVVAGSRGMLGAGILSATAALRAGAGLCLLAMPEQPATAIPHPIPAEVMTRLLPSDSNGAFDAARILPGVMDELPRFASLAVGPGVSRSEGAAEFIRQIIEGSPIPAVLDAEGLNAFSGKSSLLANRKAPLVITPHHGEMARLLGIEREAVSEISRIVSRSFWFAQEVTPSRISMAFATHERTLFTDQTLIDLSEQQIAPLTAEEQSGRNVFVSLQCSACHGGPLLSDNNFHNIGVRPQSEDIGRGAITGQTSDNAKFKTPSLRNLFLRGPFLHNGGKDSIEAVIELYNRGGDFNAPNIDRDLVRPLGLSNQQRADLAAFLKRPLVDPRVASELPPFDRPQLYTESNRVPVITGSGRAGSGSLVPVAKAIEPPYVGNPSFTVGVSGALGGSSAVVVISASDPGVGSSIPVTGDLVRTAITLSGVAPGPAG